MYVDSLERETTRVATFRFPNSVWRAFGICSANWRSCSGVGFQTTDFGSTGSVFSRVSETRVAGLTGGRFVAVSSSLIEESSSLFWSSLAQGSRRCCRRGRILQQNIGMSEILEIALTALRARITRVFPAQVRKALEPLSDEQIWWRPNESSNSIGNLVLHLSGSLDYYLNRNLGGLDFTRDRPGEFNERREIPKAELLARFDAMVANAERTFDSLTVERLGEPSPEPTMYSIAFEDLLNVAMHLANHVGQIVWIAKSLDAQALDEVWIRTHRSEGGWKPKA